jgi:hypothetical protein
MPPLSQPIIFHHFQLHQRCPACFLLLCTFSGTHRTPRPSPHTSYRLCARNTTKLSTMDTSNTPPPRPQSPLTLLSPGIAIVEFDAPDATVSAPASSTFLSSALPEDDLDTTGELVEIVSGAGKRSMVPLLLASCSRPVHSPTSFLAETMKQSLSLT